MAFNYFKTKLIPADQVIYTYDLVKNIVAPGNRAFVSPQIQIVIDELLDRKFPENWRQDPQFIKSIKESFSKKNFSTYDGTFFPEYYAAYYLPNNLYKIQLMMLELFRLGRISFSEKKIRVLDIGAAVGTTAWAISDFYEILANVMQLYGLKDEKLPILEVDSIEKSKGNIQLFDEIHKTINLDSTKVIVNSPIHGDVLNGGLDGVDLNSYDIVIASNIINEFPTFNNRKQFASNILDNISKKSSFILLETAFFRDTRDLKKIQGELSSKEGIYVISPCGKINGYSDRCNNCWSYRRESLLIPESMKSFHQTINQSDENEKLKWSYSILTKEYQQSQLPEIKTPTLHEISNTNVGDSITCTIEVVSGKLFEKGDNEHYFLKICDQSEQKENIILKIPKYFEIPKYQYGDTIIIENGLLENFSSDRLKTIQKAIKLDPRITRVTNLSIISEPKGLISFNNITQENILYFLWRFFGFTKFNEGQFDILKKVLNNQDVLGVLATGGGKSLTFQLPALLKPGVSIIVSPLKSLMDDQVNGLKNRFGFDFVDRIHSGMSLQEKKQVFERFRNGYLKILYVAPERLQQKTFQKELTNLIRKGININYFPIDEAHCISEWGHDFRPSFARLKDRQQGLPHIDGNKPSIIALTATASSKVRDDILYLLKMNIENDLIHKIIDRTELSLEVIPMVYQVEEDRYYIHHRDSQNVDKYIKTRVRQGMMKHEILLHILNKILPKRFDNFDINKDAGLIFTIYADPMPAKDTEEFRSDESREREGAFWLSKYLNENGINCKPWYGTPGYRKGQTQDERRSKQKEWELEKVATQNAYINNEINLLVSTKGFGMGIDKPNIRYIIHYGFPGSLESYFQQIGRAGRDRNHSHCILIWDGPTAACRDSLLATNNEYAIPECFELSLENNKWKYSGCPYQREWKCDYAKQIFFIESGYPSVEELQFASKYLETESQQQNCFPWVYLKTEYLRDRTANELHYKGMHKSQLNEQLMIETLYTLKYIQEFSQTYLNIGIKRSVTMREIYNSTNSEIVREHIDLMKDIYPNILDAPPTGDQFNNFSIQKYVRAVREICSQEILIDEVVEFFNILNERDDFWLSFNYYNDYGYEIKLNPKMLLTEIEQSKHFNKVTDWKKSQYAMLKNMVDYAELISFDPENPQSKCRRVHIMQVFGTESASDTIRCNYCDNCGYNNPWEIKADDVTADASEQIFALNLDKFYKNQSQNPDYLNNEIDALFKLVFTMIKQNFVSLAETKSEAWLEQIGESDNAATNLVLATINYHIENLAVFNNRFRQFLNYVSGDISLLQKVIIFLEESVGIEYDYIYKNYFDSNQLRKLSHSLTVFSSTYSNEFKEIEYNIYLKIIELQTDSISKMYDSYERLINNG